MESFLVNSVIDWDALPYVKTGEEIGFLIQEKSGNIIFLSLSAKERVLFSLVEKSGRWVKVKDVKSLYHWQLTKIPYQLCPIKTVGIRVEAFGNKEHVEDLEILLEGFAFPDRDSSLVIVDEKGKAYLLEESWQAAFFYYIWLQHGEELQLYTVYNSLLGQKCSSFEEQESLYSVL